jgi:inner membrane protein
VQGKTHSTVAIATMVAITASSFPTFEMGPFVVYPFLGLLSARTGGYFADIDKENTTYGHKYPWIAKIFKGSDTNNSLRAHRGATHTLWCLIGILGAMWFFSADLFVFRLVLSVIFGFFVGYSSHIFIDIFNRKGIPAFVPFSRKKMYMISVTTGTYQETIYMVVYLIFTLIHVVSIWGGWYI